MATNIVQPGTTPANPSRRSMLGILATGPVAMLPALAVMQCSAPADAATSSRMAQAIQRYRDACAALDRFSAATAPNFQSYREAVDAIPHSRTTNSFHAYSGGMTFLTTADAASVATARSALKDTTLIENGGNADYWATVRELVKHADRREAQIEALKVDHRLPEIKEAETRHGRAIADAMEGVINCRPTSLQDLAAKAALLSEIDAWELDGVGDTVAADIQHLAGRA